MRWSRTFDSREINELEPLDGDINSLLSLSKPHFFRSIQCLPTNNNNAVFEWKPPPERSESCLCSLEVEYDDVIA